MQYMTLLNFIFWQNLTEIAVAQKCEIGIKANPQIRTLHDDQKLEKSVFWLSLVVCTLLFLCFHLTSEYCHINNQIVKDKLL